MGCVCGWGGGVGVWVWGVCVGGGVGGSQGVAANESFLSWYMSLI